MKKNNPDSLAMIGELYAELGPVYVEAGRLDQAVTVLDTAVKEAGQTPALAAAGRALRYARATQLSAPLPVSRHELYRRTDYLVIDERLLGDQQPLYDRLVGPYGLFRKVFNSDGIVVATRRPEGSG